MAPFAGQVMKQIGRKLALIAFVVPLATGWICITWATSAVALYIGRFLIGTANASFTMTVSVYIGEMASPEIRGRLSAFQQILVNIGAVYSYVTGYFFTMFWMNIACTVIAFLYFIALLFIPESPRYDISKSKLVRAKKSLIFLRGKKYDVDQEIQTILNAQNELKMNGDSNENAYKKLFTDPVNRKSFIIVIGLIFGFQMSGMNAVLFYTSGILDQANVQLDPDLATIIVGVIFVIATLISSILVDRLGRRPLLIGSTAVLTTCLLLMGIYFLLQENGTLVDSLTWAPIVILSAFVSAHALGIGPITWIIMGEILDQSVKEVAAGFAVLIFDAFSIVALLLFPFLSAAVGDGWNFILFSIFAMVAFFFVLFFVPETKGRTLEEIQWILRNNKNK